MLQWIFAFLLISFFVTIFILSNEKVNDTSQEESTVETRHLEPYLIVKDYLETKIGKASIQPNIVMIYVHLGGDIPWIIYETLDQLRDVMDDRSLPVLVGYDNDQVGLFLEQLQPLGVTLCKIDNDELKMGKGQKGLFESSLRRFEAVELLMQKFNLSSVLHSEYDNLLFINPVDLHEKLRKEAGDRIAFPKDSQRRGMGSLIYCSMEGLKRFNLFIRKKNQELIEKEETLWDDMICLGEYHNFHPEEVYLLPLAPSSLYCFRNKENSYCDNFSDLQLVFDCAGMGQYLGGVDSYHQRVNTRKFVNETSVFVINGSTVRIEWRFRGDKRFPYLVTTSDHREIWSPIANLHMHSKKLHEFRSTLRMPITDIIQGNRFFELAHKKWSREKGWEVLKDYRKNPIVYVCTNDLDYFKPDMVDEPFILITHNSDNNITEEFLPLLRNPLLIRWFAQNVLIIHPKLVPIPIGIANKEWEHGDIDGLVRNMVFVTPDKFLYRNFGVSTHFARKDIIEHLTQEMSPRVEFTTYLKEIRRHEFILCPQGNGVDTHRLWETWYLGRIPVLCDRKCKLPGLKISPDYGYALDPEWNTEHQLLRKLRGIPYPETFSNTGRRHLRMSFWNWRIELEYRFGGPRFDVIIPFHIKDASMVQKSVQSLLRNVIGLRKIFMITHPKNKMVVSVMQGVDMISENEVTFPSFKEVHSIVNSDRTGWYFQQLLKMYSAFYPELLNYYMSWDSDTILTHPTVFLEDKDRLVLTKSVEPVYQDYGNHIKRLGIEPCKKVSFIAHHMMFNKKEMKKLITKVGGWKKILKEVDEKLLDTGRSGMSEFQLWASFLIQEKIQFSTRWLSMKWTDNWYDIQYFGEHPRFALVSFHSYAREERQPKQKPPRRRVVRNLESKKEEQDQSPHTTVHELVVVG